MNFIKQHYKTIFFWSLLGLIASQFAVTLLHWVTKPEFNLDIEKLIYLDVQCGSNEQVIITRRNVKPDGLKVDITSVAWRATEDNIWRKTAITRSIDDVVYEDKDNAFSIEIEWDKPFTKNGEYSVTTIYDMSPRGKHKRLVVPYWEQDTFNVTGCDE